jgi:hypothetical protein
MKMGIFVDIVSTLRLKIAPMERALSNRAALVKIVANKLLAVSTDELHIERIVSKFKEELTRVASGRKYSRCRCPYCRKTIIYRISFEPIARIVECPNPMCCNLFCLPV